MPSAGVSSVPSVSVIFCSALKVSKQRLRSATFAGAALAAHRAPVQDHEVARFDRGHARSHRFDGARGLVAKQERILVVDPALAVGQVGVAHPAGDDVNHGLPGAWVRDDDVDQLDGFALLA